MAESIEIKLSKILDEYDEHVQRVTNSAITMVARETVERLKNTSPKRPGGGSYARGWAIRRNGLAVHGNIVSIVVHNRTDYQLTHLLEKGHDVINDREKGVIGNAKAHPHIGPAEEWASIELPAEIERRL